MSSTKVWRACGHDSSYLYIPHFVLVVWHSGLYDIHIHLHHIPLLEHKPPKDFIYKLSTYDIMSRTLVSLPMVAKAGDILDMLRKFMLTLIDDACGTCLACLP